MKKLTRKTFCNEMIKDGMCPFCGDSINSPDNCEYCGDLDDMNLEDVDFELFNEWLVENKIGNLQEEWTIKFKDYNNQVNMFLEDYTKALYTQVVDVDPEELEEEEPKNEEYTEPCDFFEKESK